MWFHGLLEPRPPGILLRHCLHVRLLLYLEVSCPDDIFRLLKFHFKNLKIKERFLVWDTNQKPKGTLILVLWWLFECNKRIKMYVLILAQVSTVSALPKQGLDSWETGQGQAGCWRGGKSSKISWSLRLGKLNVLNRWTVTALICKGRMEAPAAHCNVLILE